MARAFVTSVVVFPAGEVVGFGFEDAVVFGDAVAAGFEGAVAVGFGEAVAAVFGEGDGLGLGDGDFLVAEMAAKGAQQAKAAMHAVMGWSLFFIGWGGLKRRRL